MTTEIIGILNYNDTSFSDGGEYNSVEKALIRIDELIEQGASLIDIGAQSTGYGAAQFDEDLEIKMLRPLLEKIKCKENISIDTYNYGTARAALEMGYSIINDVSSGRDARMLELIGANKHLKYICMFSLALPADKNNRIENVNEIFDWTALTIAKCNKHWIDETQLIIDPGIGFTTNSDQSFEIIKNINLLNNFGVKICIGHSRKSFFETLANYPPHDRDIETLATSLYLYNKVSYLRVHNVGMHTRSFKIWQKLNF